jgi:flagellar biosynthesis protein FlhF
MKIRRFVAKDMRTALAQIKEELGADAVIMSNKKIPEGVELMAAVDYSQSIASEAKVKPISAPADIAEKNSREVKDDVVSLGATPTMANNTAAEVPEDSLAALLNRQVQQGSRKSIAAKQQEPSIEQQFASFTERLQQVESSSASENVDTVNSVAESIINDRVVPDEAKQMAMDNHSEIEHSTSPVNNRLSIRATAESSELESMQQEMASIRQLLEHQVSGLMWQDMAQKDPKRAVLVNRLMALGLNEQIADQIAGYVPAQSNEDEAWDQALKLVAEQLNTTNNDIIHRGGVVALVGPTGVGKTTTIAKLAARFSQIHGKDEVALISTDTFRIAGFEQLETYGRIIGCQVKLAKDAQTLDVLLQQFSKKKLILIDTAGMGQRDQRLAEHLTGLISNARVRIRNYLVLSANAQQGVMQENVERFKKVPLSGCIYTKLDESISVGEIISTAIQNGLPIGYLTDGQRVPEDIKVANAEKLVRLADKMANKSSHQHAKSTRAMPFVYA